MAVSYPTAKADIVYLIKTGILEPLNNPTKPKVFYAPKIFSIAYSDLDEES